jgi:hypothetical protein
MATIEELLKEAIHRLEKSQDMAALLLEQRQKLLFSLESVVDMLHAGDLIKNPDRECNALSLKMVGVLGPLLEILESTKGDNK